MRLTNPTELKNVIGKHGFTFSKSLGQNFLIDENVLNAITDNSGVTKKSGALEIGPGAGVLTRALAEKAGKVVTVEIDKTLMPVLEDTLSDFDNTVIVNEDIMKTLYILLMSLCLVSTESNAQNTQFIAGFEDIPLLKTMYQNTTNDISFNNEETRYIETLLISNKKTSFNEFKKFYKTTLPQLGWMISNETENSLSFDRENDILEFQKTKESPLNVSINLKNRI